MEAFHCDSVMRRNDWKLSVPIRIRNSVEPIARFLENFRNCQRSEYVECSTRH